MKTITIKHVSLPHNVFSGCYNTIWDSLINDEIEYYLEDNNCSIDDINYTIDWHNTFNNIGSQYESILQSNYEEYGIIKIEYSTYYSPKEYNFSTDEILVHITVNKNKMYRTIIENKDKFIKILTNNHRGRDGFISFYPYIVQGVKDCLNTDKDSHPIYMRDFIQLCEYLHNGEDDHPDFYSTSESEVYDYIQGNCEIEIDITKKVTKRAKCPILKPTK